MEGLNQFFEVPSGEKEELYPELHQFNVMV